MEEPDKSENKKKINIRNYFIFTKNHRSQKLKQNIIKNLERFTNIEIDEDGKIQNSQEAVENFTNSNSHHQSNLKYFNIKPYKRKIIITFSLLNRIFKLASLKIEEIIKPIAIHKIRSKNINFSPKPHRRLKSKKKVIKIPPEYEKLLQLVTNYHIVSSGGMTQKVKSDSLKKMIQLMGLHWYQVLNYLSIYQTYVAFQQNYDLKTKHKMIVIRNQISKIIAKYEEPQTVKFIFNNNYAKKFAKTDIKDVEKAFLKINEGEIKSKPNKKRENVKDNGKPIKLKLRKSFKIEPKFEKLLEFIKNYIIIFKTSKKFTSIPRSSYKRIADLMGIHWYQTLNYTRTNIIITKSIEKHHERTSSTKSKGSGKRKSQNKFVHKRSFSGFIFKSLKSKKMNKTDMSKIFSCFEKIDEFLKLPENASILQVSLEDDHSTCFQNIPDNDFVYVTPRGISNVEVHDGHKKILYGEENQFTQNSSEIKDKIINESGNSEIDHESSDIKNSEFIPETDIEADDNLEKNYLIIKQNKKFQVNSKNMEKVSFNSKKILKKGEVFAKKEQDFKEIEEDLENEASSDLSSKGETKRISHFNLATNSNEHKIEYEELELIEVTDIKGVRNLVQKVQLKYLTTLSSPGKKQNIEIPAADGSIIKINIDNISKKIKSKTEWIQIEDSKGENIFLNIRDLSNISNIDTRESLNNLVELSDYYGMRKLIDIQTIADYLSYLENSKKFTRDIIEVIDETEGKQIFNKDQTELLKENRNNLNEDVKILKERSISHSQDAFNQVFEDENVYLESLESCISSFKQPNLGLNVDSDKIVYSDKNSNPDASRRISIIDDEENEEHSETFYNITDINSEKHFIKNSTIEKLRHLNNNFKNITEKEIIELDLDESRKIKIFSGSLCDISDDDEWFEIDDNNHNNIYVNKKFLEKLLIEPEFKSKEEIEIVDYNNNKIFMKAMSIITAMRNHNLQLKMNKDDSEIYIEIIGENGEKELINKNHIQIMKNIFSGDKNQEDLVKIITADERIIKVKFRTIENIRCDEDNNEFFIIKDISNSIKFVNLKMINQIVTNIGNETMPKSVKINDFYGKKQNFEVKNILEKLKKLQIIKNQQIKHIDKQINESEKEENYQRKTHLIPDKQESCNDSNLMDNYEDLYIQITDINNSNFLISQNILDKILNSTENLIEVKDLKEKIRKTSKEIILKNEEDNTTYYQSMDLTGDKCLINFKRLQRLTERDFIKNKDDEFILQIPDINNKIRKFKINTDSDYERRFEQNYRISFVKKDMNSHNKDFFNLYEEVEDENKNKMYVQKVKLIGPINLNKIKSNLNTGVLFYDVINVNGKRVTVRRKNNIDASSLTIDEEYREILLKNDYDNGFKKITMKKSHLDLIRSKDKNEFVNLIDYSTKSQTIKISRISDFRDIYLKVKEIEDRENYVRIENLINPNIILKCHNDYFYESEDFDNKKIHFKQINLIKQDQTKFYFDVNVINKFDKIDESIWEDYYNSQGEYFKRKLINIKKTNLKEIEFTPCAYTPEKITKVIVRKIDYMGEEKISGILNEEPIEIIIIEEHMKDRIITYKLIRSLNQFNNIYAVLDENRIYIEKFVSKEDFNYPLYKSICFLDENLTFSSKFIN